MLPNPRKFNPVGNQRYVVNRSNLIYKIMVRRGIVVPEYEEVEENAEPAGLPGEQQSPPPIEGLKPSE